MENQKDQITLFAKTNFRNKEVPFGIKTDDRRRHMYLIGKTGMGKTTVMENMAIQDIRNGHGVAFLDPHGDSIQKILDCVPNSRINDVVYFNPADLSYPVAFNILEAVDAKYKHLVASGLMGVFTKIWANLWSARMEYILNNTILALLDSPGNTLLGITRMYVDKKYRKKIVDNVKDPMVRAFWVDEFANYNEKYRTEAIAPIQNKVGQFLSSGIIRNIVGQPKSTIDLREIMDQRKILIMDLSKGKVGEDNSALLGAMLVTKLQLAAMSRTDIPEPERKDFYLYVDEFQNFATESFATILSEARKYRLNLIVGHQYIAQLEQDKNTKVRDAIFGNVGTIVVFRIGATDAEFMETEFDPIFTPTDMVNLPKYNIILKLMINGVASDPFSAITIPASPDYFSGNGEKVIKVSRERYSNPVVEVEEKISRWMGAEFHQESAIIVGQEDEGQDKELAPAVTQRPQNIVINTPQVVAQTVQVPELPAVPPAPVSNEAPEVALADTNGLNLNLKNSHEDSQDTPAVPTEQIPNRTFQAAEEIKQHKDQGGNRPARSQQNGHSGPRQQQNNHNSQRHSQHNQQHNSRPRPSGNGQKGKQHSPQKKDNPIWDTVANLQTQKIQNTGEKIASVVTNLLEKRPEAGRVEKNAAPQHNVKAPEPDLVPKAAPAPLRNEEVSNTQTQQASFQPPVPPQKDSGRTVIKPGESYKF